MTQKLINFFEESTRKHFKHQRNFEFDSRQTENNNLDSDLSQLKRSLCTTLQNIKTVGIIKENNIRLAAKNI